MHQGITYALLPSPLLGPASWRPVQAALSDAGFSAIVPGHERRPETTFDGVIAWFLDGLPDDRDYVLVPHSNAGLCIPRLTQHRSVSGFVFVDAILPPLEGQVAIAPDSLLSFLEELADSDNILPPWTRWWDEEVVMDLFPSHETREYVEAEQTCFPLSYFQEVVDINPGWISSSSAYIAFGDTYEIERSEAQRRGWVTQVLAGNHLHMLRQPEEIAESITTILT